MNNQKKILIAPLDWGNGHVTRCIPIIKALQNKDVLVYVACTPHGKKVLEIETQEVRFIDFPGYNIKYSRNPRLFALKIALQIPKIVFKIFQEHNKLKKLILQYDLDAVISDNRYGMWHHKIPSVFITHQLSIQVPSSGFVYYFVNSINRWFIQKYTACWVPDQKSNAMAGALSQNKGLKNVSYIGNLSRLEKTPNANLIYDVLIVLSGPEPQRSILENKIMAVDFGEKKVCLVRGMKAERQKPDLSATFTVYDFCNTEQLQLLFSSSNVIICRSGYSTIMDLFKVKKKAILIPTPGQTEQEYLADYLTKEYGFEMLHQNLVEKLVSSIEKMTANSANQFDLESTFNDTLLHNFVTTI